MNRLHLRNWEFVTAPAVRALVGLALASALQACQPNPRSDPPAEEPAPAPAASPIFSEPEPAAPERGTVSKADFVKRGLKWPLTLPTARVGCEPPELLWVEAGGQKYGINGMGQIHLKLPRFDDIWLVDEEYAEVPGQDPIRVMPTDLMDEARKLCA